LPPVIEQQGQFPAVFIQLIQIDDVLSVQEETTMSAVAALDDM
jgi:hypothetical protein